MSLCTALSMGWKLCLPALCPEFLVASLWARAVRGLCSHKGVWLLHPRQLWWMVKTTSRLPWQLRVWFSACHAIWGLLKQRIRIQHCKQEFTSQEKFGWKILNLFLKELSYGISVRWKASLCFYSKHSSECSFIFLELTHKDYRRAPISEINLQSSVQCLL